MCETLDSEHSLLFRRWGWGWWRGRGVGGIGGEGLPEGWEGAQRRQGKKNIKTKRNHKIAARCFLLSILVIMCYIY